VDDGVDAVVVSPPDAVVSGVRRFMVGRSGSSAGVLPVCVDDGVDAVVVSPLDAVVVSGVRRFMVGRSGSSAGFDALLVLEPAAEF
jgi:hypothetical protein